MGLSGTDVSKKAADIILTDENYATIVSATEEGRAIFADIRKALRYSLSTNMGEAMIMFFKLIFAKVIGLNAEDGSIALHFGHVKPMDQAEHGRSTRFRPNGGPAGV